jgi:circadian clock protein KaiC
MADLMPTGIEGLDIILKGGFLRGNSILIEGPPGSGKTNLALQIIYNRITMYDEPGVIVSFEQYPEQIFHDALSFGWDLRALVQADKLRVIHTSPNDFTRTLDRVPSETEAELAEMSFEIGAKRVVLDSISHFTRITQNPVELRELLLEFQEILKKSGITPIFTKEVQRRGDDEISSAEYVVDTSMRLDVKELPAGSLLRVIEVRKSRGQEHIAGTHPFIISRNGIRVFPRVFPPHKNPDYALIPSMNRISSGISGLDSMTNGGFPDNSCILVAGPTGSGKSLTAAHFIAAGIAAKEPCLYISLDDPPQKIISTLMKLGVDTEKAAEEKLLQVEYFSNMNLCIEEFLYTLAEWGRKMKVKRMVIDSLTAIETCTDEKNRLRDYVYLMVHRMEELGVSGMFVSDTSQMTGLARISEIGFAFAFDNVVFQGFVEIESRLHKVISILKMRDSDHEAELRKMIIGDNGISIGNRFIGMSGIFSGSPVGRYKETVEELFQPLFFIEGVMGRIEGLSEDKQKAVIDKVKTEIDDIIVKLGKYLDIDVEKFRKQD